MSKKELGSYFIDMNLEVGELTKIPDNMTPPELFLNVCLNSIISVGKKKGGLRMEEHSKMFEIRTDLQNAITTKETHRAELKNDAFKFLMKMWNEHTPDPQSNELVIRVQKKLHEAQSLYDKERTEN